MKLCWLIPSDYSGGIVPVVLSSCFSATKAGHEATMLMLSKPTWIDDNYPFRVKSLKLPGCSPETPIALLQWLSENPQDILFFNACEEFDVVIPYLPPQIKSVYIVHDTSFPYWRKAVAEEKHLETIVTVSETVANKFRHRLKQPEKLSVIYNGCVFPQSLNLDLVRADDLIFLGGDNPAKGAFDVLQLWKQLVKKGFIGKLHWFGGITPEFQKKIEQLPDSDRIQIYGYVQREQIFATAKSSKVLLMLSRVESFGMATVEAMSMGCVPVSWDIDTGTKEIIRANQTGLLAPIGNIRSLAQQVLLACENYPAFREVVIERARSDFDEAVMWKGYASLIDHLSELQPLQRNNRGQKPPVYQPRLRCFQLLPKGVRSLLREWVGRSPRIGYWLRDLRGL